MRPLGALDHRKTQDPLPAQEAVNLLLSQHRASHTPPAPLPQRPPKDRDLLTEREDLGEIMERADDDRSERSRAVRPVLDVQVDAARLTHDLLPLDEEKRPCAQVLDKEFPTGGIDVARPDKLNQDYGTVRLRDPNQLADGRGGIEDRPEAHLADRDVEELVVIGKVVERRALEVETMFEPVRARAGLGLEDQLGIEVDPVALDLILLGKEGSGDAAATGRIEQLMARLKLGEKRDLPVEVLAAGRKDGLGTQADEIEYRWGPRVRLPNTSARVLWPVVV